MSPPNGEDLPPGTWSLPIHGNCRMCNHHHKAIAVRFHVSEDSSDATRIPCEHCGLPWLALGGRSKTQTSLLSTQTIDPDMEEISFLRALFEFVRSATALDSVQETSAREQTNGDTSHSPCSGTQERQDTGTTSPDNLRGVTTNEDTNSTSPTSHDEESARQELKRKSIELVKVLIKSVKRKVRRHIPTLERVSIRRNTKFHSSRSGTAAHGRSSPNQVGQEPAPPRPAPPRQDCSHEAIAEADASAGSAQHGGCPPAKSIARAIEELESFGRDRLRAMTNEERAAWIRQKITSFKCRCSRQCTCRNRRASSSIMVNSSAQVHIIPTVFCDLPPRRHSLDGLGSHFPVFGPGELYDGRSLSISVTRTSEAETMVDNNTISSSPRNSGVGFSQQRQRSLSPLRRSSVWPSRHSHSFGYRRGEAQESMDSIVATGIPRSSSRGGRRRRDRYSYPQHVITSRPETPGFTDHGTATQLEDSQRQTPRPPSEASTYHMNGYVSDDERNQPPNTLPEDPEP